MKLVFTDLDGTLLNNETKISDYTRERIKYLKANNYSFIVVSGRCYSSLKKPLAEDFELFDYFITNGSS